MSKGPGRWQRVILEALETRERVILRDLLPEGYKQAELSALYRAADRLRKAGKVWICRGWREYTRVELPASRGKQEFYKDKVSVEKGNNGGQIPHLQGANDGDD